MSGATSSSSARTRSRRGTRRALPWCRRRSTSSSRSAPGSRAAILPTTSSASRATAEPTLDAEPLAPRRVRARARQRRSGRIEVDAALREDEPDIGHDRESEEGAHDDIARVMRGDDDTAGCDQRGEDRRKHAIARPDHADGEGDGDSVGGMARWKRPVIRLSCQPGERIFAVGEQEFRSGASGDEFDEVDGEAGNGDRDEEEKRQIGIGAQPVGERGETWEARTNEQSCEGDGGATEIAGRQSELRDEGEDGTKKLALRMEEERQRTIEIKYR